MSLLHQETPEEIDDAARGEEFTKGSSHVALAGLIAAALVTIAIGLYMWIGQTPPAASGEIVQVWATRDTGRPRDSTPAAPRCPKESLEQLLGSCSRKAAQRQQDSPLS